ncbi:contractile injection system protein, VgrG/Pvc8 family, partial [Sutterella sp.]|uniref:contractile injection system protein, VgrG/Pvc8 family n=1 Tax=Sutterella sp. TaxID=1981025 RepID=UPI0026DEEB59
MTETIRSFNNSIDACVFRLDLYCDSSLFNVTDATDVGLYELRIDEALSGDSSAEVLIYSRVPASTAALSAAIGKEALLTISRREKIRKDDSKVQDANRFFKGVVTDVSVIGALFQGSVKKSVTAGAAPKWTEAFAYRITLKPGIALLANTRRTRCITDNVAAGAVSVVMKDNGLTVHSLKAQSDTAEDLTQMLIFEQRDESDLAFIRRLLHTYGLNLRIGQPAKASEEIRYDLSRTWVYGADTEPPKLKADQFILTSWHMNLGTPPDAVTVNGTDGGGEISVAATKKHIVQVPDSPFRGKRAVSKAGTGASLDVTRETQIGNKLRDSTRCRIAGAIEAAARRRAIRADGEVEALAIVPGVNIVVKGFNASADTEGTVFYITRASMYCRTTWPTTLVALPQGRSSSSSFSQKVEAVEYASDEICGSFAPEPAPETQRAAGLYQGTVTKVSGSIVSAQDMSDTPALFNVQIQGTGATVVAETLRLLSQGSGATPAMPREGDQVLLTGDQGRYWILGVIGKSTAAASEISRVRADALDAVGFAGAASSVTLRSTSPDALSRVIDLMISGDLFRVITVLAWKANKADLLAAWEKDRLTVDAVLREYWTAKQNLENELQSSSKDKISAALAAFETKAKAVSKKAAEIAKTYDKLFISNKKLQTTGELTISSQGELGEYSKKHLVVADDKYLLNADSAYISADEINLSAKTKISLSVGGSKITISRDGVNLASNKWMHGAKGAFSSTISCDSTKGVTIMGMALNFKGTFSSGISDCFGGSVKASYGNVSISGNEVGTKTNQMWQMLYNLCDFTLMSALQAAASTPSTKAQEELSATIMTQIIVSQIILEVKKVYTSWTTKKSEHVWTVVETIIDVIDLVEIFMNAEEAIRQAVYVSQDRKSEYVNVYDKVLGNSNVSPRDLCRLATFAGKLTVMLNTVIPLIMKTSATATGASIKVSSGAGMKVDVADFTVGSQKGITQYVSPASGLPDLSTGTAADIVLPALQLARDAISQTTAINIDSRSLTGTNIFAPKLDMAAATTLTTKATNVIQNSAGWAVDAKLGVVDVKNMTRLYNTDLITITSSTEKITSKTINNSVVINNNALEPGLTHEISVGRPLTSAC